MNGKGSDRYNISNMNVVQKGSIRNRLHTKLDQWPRGELRRVESLTSCFEHLERYSTRVAPPGVLTLPAEVQAEKHHSTKLIATEILLD